MDIAHETKADNQVISKIGAKTPYCFSTNGQPVGIAPFLGQYLLLNATFTNFVVKKLE